MAGPVNRLRSFIRDYFTPKSASDNSARASAKNTTRKTKSGYRYCRSVPPSEWFVWAMVVLIVALMGLVAIEVSFILVTGTANVEILVVISGLIGALTSRFLEAKR